MKHLQEVFAHCRDEVTEFCESLGMHTLLSIRESLFNELQTVFSLENYNLIDRRKVSCLADKVFVMGFSLVTRLMHKRLLKLLKIKKDDSEVPDQEYSINKPGYTELLTEYLSLKQVVQELKSTMKQLSARVLVLEDNKSRAEVAEQTSPIEMAVLSETQEEKVDLQVISKPVRSRVKAEVHHDVNGVKQKTKLVRNDEIIEILDESSIQEKNEFFRHSSRDRKNILCKPRLTSKLTVAPQSNKIHSFLVYVGKLFAETSKESIRVHLQEIGVSTDDVSDILQLNNRKTDCTSFCISLNTKQAEKLVLDSLLWPTGVTVRTFRRSVSAPKDTSMKSSNFKKSRPESRHFQRQNIHQNQRSVHGYSSFNSYFNSQNWPYLDRVYDYQHRPMRCEVIPLPAGTRFGLYSPPGRSHYHHVVESRPTNIRPNLFRSS